jgi:hypothetical protein
MKPAQYTMFHNAEVEVKPIVTNKGLVHAHIVVNNQLEHTFNPSSKVSQSLSIARNPDEMKLATQQLQDRMTGGSFFFVKDTLVDHRDGHYNGFHHNDASIDKLMEVIGYQEDVSHLRRVGMRLNTTVSPIMLYKKWSVENFDVPGYIQGGAFSSGINFGWSPFMNFVKGIFEITRLICTNGMVGTSELINSKIPLQNRWVEHLAIANIQMQNKVQSKVADRLSEMVHNRATVNDLQLVTKHVRERLDDTVDVVESNILSNLVKIIDPIIHLSKYYTPAVFQDGAVCARLQGHLSEFDLWNIITEMYTHTTQSEDSTDGGLQRLANKMLFPNVDSTKGRIIDVVPLQSAFSDPDRAFFITH